MHSTKLAVKSDMGQEENLVWVGGVEKNGMEFVHRLYI